MELKIRIQGIRKFEINTVFFSNIKELVNSIKEEGSAYTTVTDDTKIELFTDECDSLISVKLSEIPEWSIGSEYHSGLFFDVIKYYIDNPDYIDELYSFNNLDRDSLFSTFTSYHDVIKFADVEDHLIQEFEISDAIEKFVDMDEVELDYFNDEDFIQYEHCYIR